MLKENANGFILASYDAYLSYVVIAFSWTMTLLTKLNKATKYNVCDRQTIYVKKN